MTMAKGKKTLTENTLVLQVWGFSVELTNPPSKNYIVTETQKHQTHIRCPVGRGSSECVMPSRESQQQREPARPILLSPRQHTLIATWNVRTMYKQGKMSMIAMEMRRYNISILGIPETRWTQTGQFRLATGELILYSGHTHDGAPHTEGVGFMLSKQADKALVSWEPISSRLITATFRTKQTRILARFIMGYAPTNDAADETKDHFYDWLRKVMGNNRPQRELTILMGDMNTRIGCCNVGYEEVMVTHGLGKMNYGEKFADLCAEHELVIGGSVFPHK